MDQMKLQSAVEYLTTYGIAILIIATVVVSLYYFLFGGLLNGNGLKAQPGSCYVTRTNIPGEPVQININGVCGAVPQYVTNFNGNGYIDGSTPATTSIQTASVWIYTPTPTGTNLYILDEGVNDNAVHVYENGIAAYTNAGYCFTSAILPNTWYFVTYVSNGISITVYLNGVSACSATSSGETPTGFHIGRYGGGGYNFNGDISNLQIYNTSLSQPEIQALYLEGIGGAPVNLQHLVGWWPLNGNANDYSGNGNSGNTANIIFLNPPPTS